MSLLRALRDLRLKWRAAGLHGAALKAESSGEDAKALRLAEETLAVLDECGRQDGPDAVAIRMTAIVLLDRMAEKLGTPIDPDKLQRAATLAKPFAGTRQFDQALAWLSRRIEDLKSTN